MAVTNKVSRQGSGSRCSRIGLAEDRARSLTDPWISQEIPGRSHGDRARSRGSSIEIARDRARSHQFTQSLISAEYHIRASRRSHYVISRAGILTAVLSTLQTARQPARQSSHHGTSVITHTHTHTPTLPRCPHTPQGTNEHSPKARHESHSRTIPSTANA